MMKNLNMILLVCLAILLFSDTSFSLPHIPYIDDPEPTNMAMYFELAAADGSVDSDDETPVTCECGGDGDVGDGNIRVPCPCTKNGGVCNCPRPSVDEVVEDIPANWTYAVLFTNDTWCSNCIVYNNNVISKLDSSWRKSNKEGGYTHLVIVDENDPLVEKYASYLNGQNGFGIPTMLMVRNGQVKWVGRGLGALPNSVASFANLFKSIR